jgi:hypothetical protein
MPSPSHATDRQLFPLLLIGMLMLFTVFVKAVPVITLINEKIGGDRFHPSGDAIVVEGTLFVIRSCVKFLVMNIGCALSDHLGRKPIVFIFILPNLCMDLMLLFADINRSVIFSFGALWGLTSITLPTLRAWVCDLSSNDPTEMVNAQGSFRGLTVGPATLIGIPLGTAFALYSNPKYAFICSLFANLLALLIIWGTSLDDTIGIAKRQQMTVHRQDVELTDQHPPDSSLSFNHHEQSPVPHDVHTSQHSVNQNRTPQAHQSTVYRSLPREGFLLFCRTHAPWSGYEAIVELFSKDPAAGSLWFVFFFTFCANEVSQLTETTTSASPLH